MTESGTANGSSAAGEAPSPFEALGVELRTQLGAAIALFGRRRKRDKRKALALRLSVVFLSASITVLLGIRVSPAVESWLVNVALGLSAAATVLSGWDAFFNHRGLWIARTITSDALESLSRRVTFAEIEGPLSKADANAFFSEMEEIVAADRMRWLELRSGSISSNSVPQPSPEPVLDHSEIKSRVD